MVVIIEVVLYKLVYNFDYILMLQVIKDLFSSSSYLVNMGVEKSSFSLLNSVLEPQLITERSSF